MGGGWLENVAPAGLVLKFTILFAVYLEAWGALPLVRGKEGGVGRNVVIRKGGLDAPERVGGVNNMGVFDSDLRERRVKSLPKILKI